MYEDQVRSSTSGWFRMVHIINSRCLTIPSDMMLPWDVTNYISSRAEGNNFYQHTDNIERHI